MAARSTWTPERDTALLRLKAEGFRALQRSDALTSPPVVGRVYLVPTVRHPWENYLSHWPVMGPRHEDPDLNFPWRHYHIDARFLTVTQERKLVAAYKWAEEKYRVSAVAMAAAARPLHEYPLSPPLPEPVYRRRICVSDGHDYPLNQSLQSLPQIRMHGSYVGRRCGRNADGGLVCPHKGFALGSLAPDADGRVVCPLHGLVIDLTTETVVAAREART